MLPPAPGAEPSATSATTAWTPEPAPHASPSDSLGQFPLPFRARALESRDLLPLGFGDLSVQIGHLGYRLAQQRTAMITAAGMFNVDKRLGRMALGRRRSPATPPVPGQSPWRGADSVRSQSSSVGDRMQGQPFELLTAGGTNSKWG